MSRGGACCLAWGVTSSLCPHCILRTGAKRGGQPDFEEIFPKTPILGGFIKNFGGIPPPPSSALRGVDNLLANGSTQFGGGWAENTVCTYGNGFEAVHKGPPSLFHSRYSISF